jgi:hypothetical protein
MRVASEKCIGDAAAPSASATSVDNTPSHQLTAADSGDGAFTPLSLT